MQRVASTGLLGFGIALGLHGLMLAVLFGVDPPEPPRVERKAPVRIRVVKRAKPKPKLKVEQPPEKKPEVKKEEPKPKPKNKPKDKPEPKTEKKTKPKKLAKLEPKPPPETAKPATEKPKAEPPKKTRKPRKFTVSMEATVSGGGVAVPTGEGGTWAYGSANGDPNGERVITSGDDDKAPPGPPPPKPPSSPRRADEVSTLPKLLSQPASADLRKYYPEQARKDGIEANVYLKILVSPKGKVTKVTMVKGAGPAFDEAAKKLVKLFRFEPGMQGDQAVAVWIPWTYKFRLDG